MQQLNEVYRISLAVSSAWINAPEKNQGLSSGRISIFRKKISAPSDWN